MQPIRHEVTNYATNQTWGCKLCSQSNMRIQIMQPIGHEVSNYAANQTWGYKLCNQSDMRLQFMQPIRHEVTDYATNHLLSCKIAIQSVTKNNSHIPQPVLRKFVIHSFLENQQLIINFHLYKKYEFGEMIDVEARYTLLLILHLQCILLV